MKSFKYKDSGANWLVLAQVLPHKINLFFFTVQDVSSHFSFVASQNKFSKLGQLGVRRAIWGGVHRRGTR